MHLGYDFLQKVLYHGQCIGAIAAETREIAQKAAALVDVKYQELTPILTIEVGPKQVTV